MGAPRQPVCVPFNLDIWLPLESHSWCWLLHILDIRRSKQLIPKTDCPASWTLSPSDTVIVVLQWWEGPRKDKPQERVEREGVHFSIKSRLWSLATCPRLPTWFCLVFVGQEIVPGDKKPKEKMGSWTNYYVDGRVFELFTFHTISFTSRTRTKLCHWPPLAGISSGIEGWSKGFLWRRGHRNVQGGLALHRV